MKVKEVPELTNSRPSYAKISPKFNQILKSFGAPHTDSFNHFLSDGIADSIDRIPPLEFEARDGSRIKLWIERCTIAEPKVPLSYIYAKDKNIYPTECRQSAQTYKGNCTVTIGWTINGVPQPSLEKDMGGVPIMLQSNACNLNKMTPAELVEHGEKENEWGGYFVVKGHEKLIRMLMLTRKNYPIGLRRSTWKDRGVGFSDLGLLIRCVQTDNTSTNNVLHYLTHGSVKLMFSHLKRLSYVPVLLIMKCLTNFSDEHIYKQLMRGHDDDQYYESCVQTMLREVHEENLHTQSDCKNYLGQILRFLYRQQLPVWLSNSEVADAVLKRSILIHLDDNMDKFNLLVYMVQKLFQLVQGKIKIEGVDCVMMQELLLGGHLYQMLVKEKLETLLTTVRYNIDKKFDANGLTNGLGFDEMSLILKHCGTLERTLETFLATGNIVSPTGLGLMQSTGLVIIAENINRMRYMSHFRAVHRGSYFVTMRTTESRALLPDAWGFICPVHTPDGSPCGLLNHLSVDCVASKHPSTDLVANIPTLLVNLGMVPINSGVLKSTKDMYVCLLDGKILGYIKASRIAQSVDKLRLLKIEGEQLPNMTEIVLVPRIEGGQSEGLYLFTSAARMMRPVMNLTADKIEWIGTFEQVYLNISITREEIYSGVTTHLELAKTAFMSNLANLIPMPDNNQSPRNMYQCQMGKQTMGTPCHNYHQQSGSKLYRLQTPATPLFRPVHYDNVDLDHFPMGTNAIVAVISYTGYDMEDAMIINKSAYERGFCHGTVYNSEFIELPVDSYFVRNPNDRSLDNWLDNDGFPQTGQTIEADKPFYCYFDGTKSDFHVQKFKGKEPIIIDNVKLLGSTSATTPKRALIMFRIVRNPSVGDKFASRAGQKGICSQKWPSEDLPFTESGLIPDIIFNPHGFPSRMTIAMMIEMMAGKSGAAHGLVHDATPFRFNEKDTAIDYFGRLLETSGYNYYGTERMYSGVDGREMKADIFFGVVHYQRLRHMVSDKWQVRALGPVDLLTKQPNKGRKKGGGVRFGEMERDALLSHGASFLLQDRLFHCSDKTTALICRTCGTLLGPCESTSHYLTEEKTTKITPECCRLCGDKGEIGVIEIPYIFKFLVTQLCSVNINVKLGFPSKAIEGNTSSGED